MRRDRRPAASLFTSCVLLAAALAPWIAPVDPTKLAMRFKFRPPGADFAFGTDNFGRSLWSRVIWGAQLSVIIGFSVVVLNAVFGTLIGLPVRRWISFSTEEAWKVAATA